MLRNLDPIYMLLSIPGLLLGFVLHEFAHAKMSDALGDPTPRSQGRITLDPRSHIDIIGFIVMLIAGFGWAKPVMTNPRFYKKPRRDDILVSIAGPLMNLLIAVVFYGLTKILLLSNILNNNIGKNVASLLVITAGINVVLFVLNMIPFPMFDGYHVISNLFNTWRYRFFNLLEQYGMFIFILLAVSGMLGKIISPVVNVVNNFLINLILY
ncbi:site-2 protease family protein [Ruminiclostridium cellobioparum]|uniref:Zn-dependent protease n=1 Tax=Ruminiclostridium cellobioparum subsp. termitidis CT1112 TaxID=1195236 RepID=S0FMN3_RUMCE|nr:site-2 protease family protein [Ruminiclostridium cellobioparum]EMS73167.1 Zn-dependent protease [Ruminiclostridium cellobioparum subsp. termitidis CT1112]